MYSVTISRVSCYLELGPYRTIYQSNIRSRYTKDGYDVDSVMKPRAYDRYLELVL